MKKIYLEKRLKQIAPWLFDNSYKWTGALEALFSTFSPQIHESLEISLSHPPSRIGFIVGDSGEAFFRSIEQFLLAIKIPARTIEMFRSVNALFPGVGILFKTSLFQKNSPSASVYYQFPLPLKMTARLAALLGLKQFPSSVFQEIGLLLMKKGVYPGLDFKANGSPALALYYPVRRAHSGILPALQAIVERLRMGAVQRERLAQIHTALSAVAEGCLYVSFAFDGKLLQSLKLDYEYVRTDQAMEALKNLGISSEEVQMVGDAARVLERSALNYVGVKFEGTSRATFQYYFIRSARETFPDNLEQIRWIPA